MHTLSILCNVFRNNIINVSVSFPQHGYNFFQNHAVLRNRYLAIFSVVNSDNANSLPSKGARQFTTVSTRCYLLIYCVIIIKTLAFKNNLPLEYPNIIDLDFGEKLFNRLSETVAHDGIDDANVTVCYYGKLSLN